MTTPIETFADLVPADFNWRLYVANYADLQRAGIDTREQAECHWRTFGCREGRTFHPRTRRTIVIAGLSKTGTTALLYRIADAIADFKRIVFEAAYVPEPGDDTANIVAKYHIGRDASAAVESYRDFTHKIAIIRDPRDRLISNFLFLTQNRGDIAGNTEFIRTLVALLKRKEQQPAAVSFTDISRQYGTVGLRPEKGEINFTSRFADFLDHHPEYFPFRYEAMVAGRLRELETFLGLSLAGETRIPSSLSYVVRTRQSGDFRNWFQPSDVDRLRPLFAPVMQRLGYTDDWDLSAQPSIPPEYGSSYVLKIVNERRLDMGLPPVADNIEPVGDTALAVLRATGGAITGRAPRG